MSNSEKNSSSALKPNAFTKGRGKKKAWVKLTKTSQNTALLWLTQPFWLVPKHRRRLQPWLSMLIKLDVCVNCLKAADPHRTLPDYIIEHYQTCFVHYQEAEKGPSKKAERLSRASTGWLLNKCPQRSWIHHVGAQTLGKASFIIIPRKSPLKATHP